MDALMRATVRFRNLSNSLPPPKLDGASCTCSGWIEKKMTSGPTSGKWRKRYCLLFQDYLYMFRNQEDAVGQSAKPTSVISLTGTRVKEHFSPLNPNANNNEESLHMFEIYSDNTGGTKTEAFIGVPSKEEREMWIQAIKKVIYGLRDGGVFGKSLIDNMDYEYRHSRRLIPLVVIQTADFIDAFGLQTEGIFRHAGRTALVKELKHKYDSGEAPMLDVETVDVHSVASLLKLYFRELPDPVVPYESYSSLLDLSKSIYHHRENGEDLKTTSEMQELAGCIADLPKYSYNLLRFMCQFLCKVSQYSAENKMDANNLATVFGPNILRSRDDNPLISLSDSALISFLVSLMIFYCDFIFKLEYNKEGNKVRTDTLINLVMDQATPPSSLLRASGFASEDDLLEAVSSDEDKTQQAFNHESEVTYRRKHSAPPGFTGDMLMNQEPLCSSPDESPFAKGAHPLGPEVRASLGIFPKPQPRRKSLSRQSTPPNHPLLEQFLESAEKRSSIDLNVHNGERPECEVTPRPPARNRNRKDVLRSMAEVSPGDAFADSGRPNSYYLDPKLAPTPEMMHMQIASLKREIERQRTAHEGLVDGLKKQVEELQEKLATRDVYYKQEMGAKNKTIKDQDSKLLLLQEQVSDIQNKMQTMFETLTQKEKENIRLELDLQKMVTKLALETQANMNLKTELGSLQLSATSKQ